MINISASELQSLFSPIEIIEIVRNGIKKYGEGKYDIPERMHIHRDQSTHLIMPAFGEQYHCTKLVSVNPQNSRHDLPLISGILILNDSHTGQVLASMDAPMITALRTAAVGSIGLDLISTNQTERIGIIGLGVQGYWQATFAIASKDVSVINCYSRRKSKYEAFHIRVNSIFPDVKVNWSPSAEKVVQNSDAIFTCTTSKNPVFDPSGLDLTSKRFISVGSFTRDMQELPDDVYKQADEMIIDVLTAKTEVGDVINTIINNWIPTSNIHSLADILNSKSELKTNKNTVFKSVGMSAFDLALAIVAYERKILNQT